MVAKFYSKTCLLKTLFLLFGHFGEFSFSVPNSATKDQQFLLTKQQSPSKKYQQKIEEKWEFFRWFADRQSF